MSKRPSADPRAVQAAPPRAEGGRLAPPRSGPGVLVREALVQRLLDARRKRCVLVRGPAGFGKTTLLASWLQALLPLGFDVAWLSLEAHDDALAPFVDGLVAAFAEVDPALIREAAELADAAIDADGAERLVIALVRRIAEHPRDLVLVLDDVHHLNDPAVLETLQWLLDYAPPGLHLVLGTRGAMRLSLDALRAQGQLFELELRDLRFSLTEAEQFLKLQLGEVDARTVKLLYELSDGWVAGLQLFAIDWKNRQRLKGEGGVGFTRVPMRDPEAFARYFDQEVLNRLSPGDLESLVRLSACERFCAPLCAALDDKRQSAGEAAAMLRRLQVQLRNATPMKSPSGLPKQPPGMICRNKPG